jgi:hypothetical protein
MWARKIQQQGGISAAEYRVVDWPHQPRMPTGACRRARFPCRPATGTDTLALAYEREPTLPE